MQALCFAQPAYLATKSLGRGRARMTTQLLESQLSQFAYMLTLPARKIGPSHFSMRRPCLLLYLLYNNLFVVLLTAAYNHAFAEVRNGKLLLDVRNLFVVYGYTALLNGTSCLGTARI